MSEPTASADLEPADLQPDWLDRAAGLAPGNEIIALRRGRPEFFGGAETCRPAVLAPKDEGGLSKGLRAALAHRMACQSEDRALAAQYRALLTAAGPTADETAIADGAEPAALSAPLDALVRHADLITLDPGSATAGDIQRLAAAGFSEQQIVALSELIGFLNFETRVAHALRLIEDARQKSGAVAEPRPPVDPAPAGRDPAFRLKPLTWIPHITPIEFEAATPEQLDAMQVTPSSGKVSPYVLTLVHDPESYLARTELFNAIMYVPDGLRLQDRELGALVASMHNGCAFCSFIHAGRQSGYAKSTATIHALYTGREDRLGPRDAAIVDFARRLSATPPTAGPEHLAALYAHGFGSFEVIDLVHAIAIFGWANRLMHVLGHSVLTESLP